MACKAAAVAVLLLAACVPGAWARDLFDSADTDMNGVLDRGEFSSLTVHLQQQFSALVGAPAVPAALDAGRGSAARLPSVGNAGIAGVHADVGLEHGSASVEFPLIGDLDSTSFWAAFVNSLLMIIVTEIGDKTFFIAAVLAMRHDRHAVFLGAIGALALMTVLSAAMGFALPNLLPRQYTHYASALLFLYFGVRLLKDASEMRRSGPSDELQEVEEELIHKKEGDEEIESGECSSSRSMAPSPTPTRILYQAFTLTFLAEWGDRSQIATIALAAAKDPFGVTLGGVIGHSLCTGIAVIGGRMLAARISERTVAIVGGCLFLAFAMHSFFVPL